MADLKVQAPPMTGGEPGQGKRMFALACALLVTLCLAAFFPLHRAQFLTYDDELYVTQNEQVQGGLSLENMGWAFTNKHFFYYPVTWLSHMLDCQLFGLSAGGHHATSVLIHMAGALLLLIALRSMTGALWRSFLASALFAVHPLHVESVAWVAERKDVLSALFLFLTLIAYARYAKTPGAGRYMVVCAAFLLGLMSKSMVVTAPALLLLLDFWPLGRWSPWPLPPDWRRLGLLILEKLPLLALSALFSYLTYHLQKSLGAMSTLTDLPLGNRLANALISYVEYLWKTLLPIKLSVFYPLPASGIPLWEAALCLAFLAAVTAFAIALSKRWPHIAVGWLWYLGTLVPVIGIIQVGMQRMADRYTYIPLVGIFILLAWSLPAALFAGRRFVPATAAVALLLVTLAGLANRQSRFWMDDITLFSHSLTVEPKNNSAAHSALGTAFYHKGELEKAAHHLEQALAIRYDMATTLLNLGSVYAGLGKPREAEQCFEKALKLNPKDDMVYLNMGLLATGEERWAEAVGFYRKALEINPGRAQAANNLAWTLMEHDPAGWGNHAEAESLARRACLLTKNQDPNFMDTLAEALFAAGKVEEAEKVASDAAALARSLGQDDMAADIESRAGQYKARAASSTKTSTGASK